MRSLSLHTQAGLGILTHTSVYTAYTQIQVKVRLHIVAVQPPKIPILQPGHTPSHPFDHRSEQGVVTRADPKDFARTERKKCPEYRGIFFWLHPLSSPLIVGADGKADVVISGFEITWGFLGCRVDVRENRKQSWLRLLLASGRPATEAVEVKVKEKRIREQGPQVLSEGAHRTPSSARDH